MLIRDIPRPTLAASLGGQGIHLVTGAFTIRLRIELPSLVDEFAETYALYPVDDPAAIDDACVRIAAPSVLRRYLRPQAQVWADGDPLFEPVPAQRAFTLVESAFNWAVAASEIAPLLVHAAVLEKAGRAVILPAPTGSGKSTLCAALALRGWRLFSDEMGVFSLHDGWLCPNPRPVSLKNDAIGLIGAFDSRARLTRTFRHTPKGDVAYMHAPADAVMRAQEKARAGLIVAPAYAQDAAASLTPMSAIEGFRCLTENAVNYGSMLQVGFDMITHVAETCPAYALTYSRLDDAISLIEDAHRRSLDAGRPA